MTLFFVIYDIAFRNLRHYIILLLFAITAKSNQKARWLRGNAASQSKSLIYLNNNKRRGKPRRIRSIKS